MIDPDGSNAARDRRTILTHALIPGSQAIDAGDNSLIPSGVTTDQRGLPRIVDGNSDSTATVDIGSFEAQ